MKKIFKDLCVQYTVCISPRLIRIGRYAMKTQEYIEITVENMKRFICKPVKEREREKRALTEGRQFVKNQKWQHARRRYSVGW